MDRTAFGMFHVASSSVQDFSFAIFTTASMQNSNDATWEQTSPSPAMQVQWAVATIPVSLIFTQGFSGVSFALWE